jgi:NAD(P)-dependent dehydrogenase (short-subunit alcohol dehydrogenase family)
MTIVITGASRGIGKAIAGRFIREGWDAALCGLNQSRIRDTAEAFRQDNPQVRLLAEAVDVGRKPEVAAFAEKILDIFPVVDVLVNNAGVFVPGNIHEEEEGILESTMAVNLFGAYHLSRALLPSMMARQQGHVFNICSTASLQAYPHGGAYSITKHALLGFSRNLREEMKPFGIKVTAVCPGPTWTDSWKGFEGPEDRMMPPEDVAEIIWQACQLAPQTVIEDIVMRPQKGDIR